MKSTIIIAVLCISMCLGQTFREPANPKAGKGKCLSANPKIGVLRYGQSKSIRGQCVKYSCQHNGDILGTGCGTVFPPKGCTVKADSKKPYPACCPKVKC